MLRLRLGVVVCGSITERGLLPHLMFERDHIEVASLCDISQSPLFVDCFELSPELLLGEDINLHLL